MEIENILEERPELIEASIGLLEILMINPTDPGDLRDTITTILRATTDSLNADACALLIINPITGQFLRRYTYIESESEANRFRSEAATLDRLTQDTLNAAKSKDRVLFVQEFSQHPEYANPFEPEKQIHSVATVALLTHRKRQRTPLAVLYVGFNQSRQTDTPSLTLLRILSDQASSALQHTWSLRRYKEVERIGHEINQQLQSVEGVFQNLMAHVPGIIDTNYFLMMAIHDSPTNTLDFYFVEEGEFQVLTRQPYRNACAWVIQNRKRLSVRHFSKEKDQSPNQVIGILEGTQPFIPESLEFVPLIYRDETLGVLSVQQKFPNAYDEEDRHILDLLANHTALALTNLRLLDNLNRLNEAGQNLTSNLNSSEILNLVTASIREVVKSDVVALYPYLPEKGFEFPVHLSGELLQPNFLKPNFSRSDDLATLTLNAPAPIFAKDSSSLYAAAGGDPNTRQGNFEVRENIRSTAALPLRVGGERVGVLFVNYRNPQSFRPAQQKLIEGMANYAAIAIRNAREFGTLAHKRLREISMVQRIDRAISKTLDLEQILQTILEEASEHLRHSSETTLNGAILIHNPQTDRYEVKAASGPSAKLRLNRSISLREEKGITLWVAENGVPALVNDVHKEPWKSRYIQIDSKTRSELDVPLLNEDDTVAGILSFESDVTNRFTQEDQDFLVMLGVQAILAIHNAQAYTREKQAKEAQKAVQEIGHQIVSELDFRKVGEFILAQACQLTGSKGGEILLYDEQRNDLNPVAERGVSLFHRRQRTPANKGIAGWVLENRKFLNVNITEPPWRERYVRFIRGVTWELAVPMLKGKAALGVINLESSDPFTEYDVQLISELSDLAVIALSNSRNYAQEKDAVERFQLLYEAGLALGKVIDPANIEHAYDFAIKSFSKHKDGQVAIRRYDEEKKELVLVHESRPTNTNPLYVRIRNDEGVNGWVATHRTTAVVGDTLDPPKGIKPKPSDEKTRMLVAAPITFGDRYYGNLALSHQQPHFYRLPDIMLIEGLANQLGVTINRLEISSAQQDAERRAKESELMSSIGQSATELTHRLAGDLGLIETYVETILDVLEREGVSDSIIDDNLADLLNDVKKVLSFSLTLKEDVKALEDESPQQLPSLISVRSILEETERSLPKLPPTVRLVRHIAADLPDLRVVPNQIISSLSNLIRNASEAMPHGGTIMLSARKAHSEIEIAVHDNGIGIPQQNWSRIFSLFFSTKGSSGFGLWSAHRNAIANGGKLIMDSTVGKGSRFTLILPPAEIL